MSQIKFTLTAVCVTVLLTAAAAAAQGTLSDRKTVVSVRRPGLDPGTTLPGRHLCVQDCRLCGQSKHRQIFDKDEAKIIATLLAVSRRAGRG